MEATTTKHICCIGAGYVGGPTCAVIAKQNADVEVTVVDLSEERIAAWKSDHLPIFEPNLFDVVKIARDGTDGRRPNLHFSTNIRNAIQKADIIFIAVNTPTKTAGWGAGSASDLVYVESAARMIAEYATTDKIVVEKSTVPCGTADSLRNLFANLSPDVRFDILSNPEFLAEGTAIADLLNPDRVLIGSLADLRSRRAADALANLYSWVAPERIIRNSIWSSELAKLAANCLLAQRISSINSLSALCEDTGADIEELAHSVGLDNRIGQKMLRASAGFGGSCFKKDVLSLVYIAETLHLDEVARYWRTIVDLNEYQKRRFARRITKTLNNTLARKKIAILGWAYKKNTGDTRESAAITIAGQLAAEGAKLAIYDPQVSARQIYLDLGLDASHPQAVIEVCEDPIAACTDASALVILTEWDEFRTDYLPSAIAEEPLTAASSDSGIELGEDVNDISKVFTPTTESISTAIKVANRLDWQTIARIVQRPRHVFDGRNIVEPEKLRQLGLQVHCIGKSSIA